MASWKAASLKCCPRHKTSWTWTDSCSQASFQGTHPVLTAARMLPAQLMPQERGLPMRTGSSPLSPRPQRYPRFSKQLRDTSTSSLITCISAWTSKVTAGLPFCSPGSTTFSSSDPWSLGFLASQQQHFRFINRRTGKLANAVNAPFFFFLGGRIFKFALG